MAFLLGDYCTSEIVLRFNYGQTSLLLITFNGQLRDMKPWDKKRILRNFSIGKFVINCKDTTIIKNNFWSMNVPNGLRPINISINSYSLIV